MFKAIDKNHDGYISRSELEEVMGGMEKSQQSMYLLVSMNESVCGGFDLEGAFAQLDQDGDERITFSEFVIGVSNKASLLRDKKLRVVFDFLDSDRSGFLDKD